MYRVKELVHAKKVYQRGLTGRGIGIAVLDTGVSLHPDLLNRTVVFRDFIHGRSSPYDDNGHGTHIAGILCGNGSASQGAITGMAPGAHLVCLKVLDEQGNGDIDDVIKALRWLRDNYRKYKVRLLNFSVGYLPGGNKKDQQMLLDTVDELWDEGIMVITAAGNNGPGKNTVTVPGISRKVVTVGCSDDGSLGRNGFYTGYSGKGPTACCIVKPEILAPGTKIKSLSHKGNGYVEKSGTSMAAPIVCGAMALAMESDPNLTPSLLKLQLYESVDRPKEEYARKVWGILNVDNLIEMV